nr:hypothetical protein [uncultured Methanobacterium sp.]
MNIIKIIRQNTRGNESSLRTFLTSLIMIKCHDTVADQAASEFNVTWSATGFIGLTAIRTGLVYGGAVVGILLVL